MARHLKWLYNSPTEGVNIKVKKRMAIKLQSQLITITIKPENLLKLESGLYNRRKKHYSVF